MTQWHWVDPSVVRARIATLQHIDLPGDARLGDIVLREHQREAAARLRHSMNRFGGALLADEVGLGKTYTALAAMRDASTLLVVAPAALAPMWQTALERSRMQADLVSFETLSRREGVRQEWEAVIIDEAHHARNPLTRRYASLAWLTRRARVLLLSATPVHNSARDLGALLSLFLGSRAERMTPSEVSACIVRRTRGDVRGITIPGRTPPVWCDVPSSPEVLRAILEVPPPCPQRDGGDAGSLVTLSLVRAWSSSDAALRAALRRRVSRAEALADALATGRHPSKSELRAWVIGDDATQLAFPELVSDGLTEDVRGLLATVRAHAAGARLALTVLAANAGVTDDHRCRILREIRQRHAGERLVVFSQFADTVHEIFTRLRSDGGIAAVTANGALVAGGPLTRSQVLDRFAPVASSSRPPSRAEAIEVLIATDLLSEGLNLQDAAVVVHLDLPWTNARLTQRLGRIWRIGSEHARVHEYALAPPAAADHMVRITEVLTRKAGAAWSTIGEPVLPLLASRAESASTAPQLDRVRAGEEVRALLRGWVGASLGSVRANGDVPASTSTLSTAVAGVRAPFDGWIAVVEIGGDLQLVAAQRSGGASTDPRCVLEAARASDGPGCVASPSRVDRVLREIDGYLDALRGAADAGVNAVGSRARATASSRIAAVAAAAPPHRRPAVSRLAAAARDAVAGSRSAGAERLLAALVSSRAGDEGADAAEAWLERIIEMTESATPNAPGTVLSTTGRVHALIVLVPTG